MSISKRLFGPCLLVLAGFSLLLGIVGALVLSALRPVHAQSSIWEVISHPEPAGGAMLAIVRHVATRECYVIAQGEGVAIQPVSGTLCGDPPNKWESLVIGSTSEGLKDESTTYWRFNDDKPSQPSAGQTSKQPGVPR